MIFVQGFFSKILTIRSDRAWKSTLTPKHYKNSQIQELYPSWPISKNISSSSFYQAQKDNSRFSCTKRTTPVVATLIFPAIFRKFCHILFTFRRTRNQVSLRLGYVMQSAMWVIGKMSKWRQKKSNDKTVPLNQVHSCSIRNFRIRALTLILTHFFER